MRVSVAGSAAKLKLSREGIRGSARTKAERRARPLALWVSVGGGVAVGHCSLCTKLA